MLSRRLVRAETDSALLRFQRTPERFRRAVLVLQRASVGLLPICRELRVVDHLATFGDVAQQLFGGGTFLATEWSHPLQQFFVSGFIAVVLEHVQQRGDPGLSGGGVVAEHTVASGMDVFRQVAVVQAASLELPLSVVQLRRNPTRAIHADIQPSLRRTLRDLAIIAVNDGLIAFAC